MKALLKVYSILFPARNAAKLMEPPLLSMNKFEQMMSAVFPVFWNIQLFMRVRSLED
jgi:hypothetical protein